MLKLIAACFTALVVTVSAALAQAPVLTQPYPTTSTVASDTIDVTSTFQRIWAQSSNTRGRAGCIVQNNGSADMFLFFGALASATTPTSLRLTSGSMFRCNDGGIVMQDEISITGTAGEAFFATQQ